jgi:hypothetical protein
MNSLPLWVAQTLASAFLSVLFLQSGLDKVLDWKGNKEYIGGYFAKTPLRRLSTFLLFNITVLEVFTGIISAAGCLTVFLSRSSGIAFAGATLAGLCVVSLFLGQRLAKDYAAAAGMVPYAMFAIGSVLLQGATL